MTLPQFLEERVRDDASQPTLLGVCAGFENGSWRCKQFAQHLILDCMLDFLAHGEKEALTSVTTGRQLYEAAKIVYQTDNYKKRGEFGELLLHVVMRHFYGTLPAVSKLFVKTGVNDTVKGFDAVHVAVDGTVLELWLGEVKFYSNARQAILDVTSELQDHFKADYLRNEFNLIGNYLDPSWPHTDVLKGLIAPQSSLDKIFAKVHVPVMVTYESAVIGKHGGVTDAFKADLLAELNQHRKTFLGATLPDQVLIHFLLVPLGSKSALQQALDERLKALQSI
ncbi:MAG: DUF1837 domain-containing protein [Fimbriimonadaceae bacterium]|nr:DUF1837 domain-containing protein [Fimbriimonadaceae bacterium]